MSNIVPGMLSAYFYSAIVVALPASLLVLMAYRHAVQRGMLASASSTRGRARGTASLAGSATGARAVFAEHSAARLLIVYGVAGFSAGLLTALTYMLFGHIELGVTRILAVSFACSWPLVPTYSALVAQRRRHIVALALGYLACGIAVVGGWSFLSSLLPGHDDISVLENLANCMKLLPVLIAPPALIVALTSARKLRPVLPLLLAGLLLFSVANMGITALFVSAVDVPSLRTWIFRLGVTPVFMMASLPVGYVCWRMQRWLGRHFEQKHFSDVQLVVDSWWFIAIVFMCTYAASDAGWHALWMLSAFVVYRVGVGVGLRLWPVSSTRPSPVRLLLLRVFRAPAHAERLFDVVAQRWRNIGSVHMIAGTDLAARTVDPGDVLTFLNGELRQNFVRDADDLRQRLRDLDVVRDPDGRFRVNELYCYDDTWRAALEALLAHSDVVLMDLRGFSRDNQGCIYELQKLAQHSKLLRTLILLDAQSDEKLLHQALTDAAIGHASDTIEVLRLTRQSAAQLSGVVERLELIARRELPRQHGFEGA